jgi:ketol-acid reductoisomerase
MYNPIVAIIGFGRAGKIHYQNLKEMNINIKYIVDYNCQEIKKSIGSQIRVTQI